MPNRRVRRTVQGVDMVLPWSHRLPDYAEIMPEYGQNLVRLAALLASPERPVQVLDIGANVGDSTLQILAAAPGRVLCVEADPGYLTFLHANVDGDNRIEVEPSLLTVDDAAAVAMAPVRKGGTARFEAVEEGAATAAVSPEELWRRHPSFDDVRLVKSDTDGYDVELVPAVARSLRATPPVLFFEYDHKLSRVAGNDPVQVWADLADLGYEHVAVWDFAGRVVGRVPVIEMATFSAPLDEETTKGRSHLYWDVAVVHGGDAEGLQALEALIPG